jgi:hypothetical protein
MASVVMSISDLPIWEAMISKVKATGELNWNLLEPGEISVIEQWTCGEAYP